VKLPVRQRSDIQPDQRRALPSVNELAIALAGVPPAIAVRTAREVIDAGRERIGRGEPVGDLESEARVRADAALITGPRPVLNATGVVLHTNLGRAPLAGRATRAAADAGAGYSDLEYDLERGGRGSRQSHVAELLRELTGADAALVVNNCAGAVLLATTAVAAGRRVVVSRGQLVEIGGSFRIPEIVEQSGARLAEVGTTNRTRLADYRRALDEETGAILWAHPSNYRVVGFVEEVALEELCGLGVPVIADLGSGVLLPNLPALASEPAVQRAVAAGAALVCFSGDKLLGGPQAGIIVGTGAAIEHCRAHPLARALRIDKLSLAALAATLALYRDPALAVAEIPVLRMLSASSRELGARARAMSELIAAAGYGVEIVETSASAGGGSLPLVELTGPACSVDPTPYGVDALARRLRTGTPPVIGRALHGRLLLDPRALTDAEARQAAEAVVAALAD
jgi:L-seryl-tRNA(Ser) seleniumtransferase